MNDQSPMSDPKTSGGSPSATSSAESQAGRTLFDLQDGPQAGPCGQDQRPASRSRRRASAKAQPTSDTCGQSFTGSSQSAGQRLSSGSKSHPQKLSALSVRLLSLSRFKGAITREQTRSQSNLSRVLRSTIGTAGSMEYSLIWKEQVTPAGRPFCLLRASGRRTSGTGFGGWPSPQAHDVTTRGNTNADGHHYPHDLSNMVQMADWPTPTVPTNTDGHQAGNNRFVTKCRNLAGWPTPKAGEAKSSNVNLRGNLTLKGAAQMAGWPTPNHHDGRREAPDLSSTQHGNLSRDAVLWLAGWATLKAREQCQQNSADSYAALSKQVSGVLSTSSPAGTERRGALNAAHSRWLMGLPWQWDRAAILANRTLRQRRKHGSCGSGGTGTR